MEMGQKRRRVLNEKLEDAAQEEGSAEREARDMEMGQKRRRVEDFDPAIWADLPFHILEEVLLRLPLDSLGRFRGVCRDWNKMLQSTSFAKERAFTHGPDAPWILTFLDLGNREILASVYESERGIWRTTTFSDMQRYWHNQGLVSDGGLVCFNNFVVNLVTGSKRELECGLPDIQVKLSAFKVDTAKNVYRAFFLARKWADPHLEYDYLLIYDSEQNSWRKTENSPAAFNIHGPGVVVDDCVYFIRYGSDLTAALTLIYYNLKKDTWGSHVVMHYRGGSQWTRTLHHWQGGVYLISWCEGSTIVHVDKINFETSQCSPVSSIRKVGFGRVLGTDCPDIAVYDVTSCANVIVVFVSYAIRVERLVFYDLATNIWSSTKEPVYGKCGNRVVAVEPRPIMRA